MITFNCEEKFSSNGWLLVDKPEGVESFGVIRKLKFRFQFHKIGFAGTLDPLATGLLLIGINKATKKIPDIHKAQKTYQVQIRFGAKTPTLDSEGRFQEMKSITHSPLNRIYHLKNLLETTNKKSLISLHINHKVKIFMS